MSELEKALHFAAEAKDIDSLKALARAEARRADLLHRVLAAVLRVTDAVGPESGIELPADVLVGDLDSYFLERTAAGGVYIFAEKK